MLNDVVKIFYRLSYNFLSNGELYEIYKLLVAYSEPYQTSEMKRYVKLRWKLLTVFVKHSILDVWQGS